MRGWGGVGWEPYPAPFKVNLGLSFFPAPSDTVAIFPAGGAHTFLCFTSKEKFAVFMQLKAKGNQGYCVTHFTADFTFSVQCDMSGGRTVCSDLRSGHCAWSLPPKALGAAGSSAGGQIDNRWPTHISLSLNSHPSHPLTHPHKRFSKQGCFSLTL